MKYSKEKFAVRHIIFRVYSIGTSKNCENILTDIFFLSKNVFNSNANKTCIAGIQYSSKLSI